MNKREIALFRILSESREGVSTEELCSRMSIRPRTLRESIRIFREETGEESGAVIEPLPGIGYRLVITEKDRYYRFMKEMLESEVQNQYLMPADQEDRVNFIVRTLLSSRDMVTAEKLCDKLYISHSTFASDLRKVREEMGRYNLAVETRSSSGIRVEGKERDIRRAMADYFFHSSDFDVRQLELRPNQFFNEVQEKMIRSLLYETLRQHHLRMSDVSFRNLVIHILIAINRIRGNTYIQSPISALQELKGTREWETAEDLYHLLSEKLDIVVPEEEIGYVTTHLLGKRMIDNEEEMMLHPETLNLVSLMLEAVNARYGYDFRQDIELYTALSMHLQPLLQRSKYGLEVKNPMRERIETEAPVANDMALLSAQVIQRETGYAISEDEAAYLALHYQLAIERGKKIAKKKVLVICSSGAGTSRILAFRIRQQFSDYIEKVDTTGYFDYMLHPSGDYDLIISTVPLPGIAGIPVVQISGLLDNDDASMIRQAVEADPEEILAVRNCFDRELFFSGVRFKDPDEVIHFLCGKMKERINLPEDFEQLVREREAIAPTAIGGMVAVPHPARLVLDEMKTAVCCLAEPVDWHGKPVQFVFLMGMQKDSDELFVRFHDVLFRMVSDPQMMNRLRTQPSFDNLMRCIDDISAESGNEPEDIFQ